MREKLLSIDDAANVLGVAAMTVRSWVRTRRIASIRLGRRVLIDPKDLQQFMEAGRIEALTEEERERQHQPIKGVSMLITAPTYRQASTRPLEPEDVEPVLQHLARESDRASIRYRLLLEGVNTAFLIHGRVVAAGGFQMIHVGVADPWLVITPEGRAHFRPLYRAVVAWLLEQREAYHLHRLQAFVRHDDDKGRVLLQHLGFDYEGVARQLGPDRADYHAYAWVRRDEPCRH